MDRLEQLLDRLDEAVIARIDAPDSQAWAVARARERYLRETIRTSDELALFEAELVEAEHNKIKCPKCDTVQSTGNAKCTNCGHDLADAKKAKFAKLNEAATHVAGDFEVLHPRDRLGQWMAKLNRMKIGERVELPKGVRVSKKSRRGRYGDYVHYEVRSPGAKIKRRSVPYLAARVADQFIMRADDGDSGSPRGAAAGRQLSTMNGLVPHRVAPDAVHRPGAPDPHPRKSFSGAPKGGPDVVATSFRRKAETVAHGTGHTKPGGPDPKPKTNFANPPGDTTKEHTAYGPHLKRLRSIGATEQHREALVGTFQSLSKAQKSRGSHQDEDLTRGWVLPGHVRYHETGRSGTASGVQDRLNSLVRLGVAERSRMRGGKFAYRVAEPKGSGLRDPLNAIGGKSTVPKRRGANPKYLRESADRLVEAGVAHNAAEARAMLVDIGE